MRRQSTSGLIRTVDLALFCILCLAPFFLGGRYPIGRLVYVVLAITAAVAWILEACFDRRIRWHRTSGIWIILLGFGILVFQVIPLPSWLISGLHPTLLEKMPLWSTAGTDTGQLGIWSQISLAPQATLAGTAIFLAYGMIFLIACQRINSLRDVERIIGWIALSTIVLALAGLIQYVIGTNRYLGIYEHPFRSPKPSVTAAFYNGNHFAHMLALGMGPLFWCLISFIREPRHARSHGNAPPSFLLNRPLVILIGIGIVFFAGLMTMSRGGILVIILSSMVAAALLWRCRLLPRTAIAALGISALIVTAAIAIHGLDRVAPQMEDLTSGSVEQLDRHGVRRAVWSANMDAITDFWILGAGIGVHRHLLPTYLKHDYGLEFTHAESGYLQIALEAGVVGILLCFATVLLCFVWCWKGWRRAPNRRHAAAVAAVFAGLLASALHSVWDFVWYIPATMAATVILAACACRLAQLATPSHPSPAPLPNQRNTSITRQHGSRIACLDVHNNRPMPPALAWSVLAIVVSASLWMLNNRIGPAFASPAWDQYLRTSVETRKNPYPLLSTGDKSEQDRALIEERAVQTDAMITFLKEVLRRDPMNARAHLRLAGQCLVRFEIALEEAPNRMPLSQIRDAAAASHFESRNALDDWLSRAIGPARAYLDLALQHARRGTELCPIEGDGYLFLSDLCFLEGRGSLSAVYLDQARRVRPYEGDVLLRLGTESWIRHDVERAVEYWRQAYRTGKPYQIKLFQTLAGNVPVQFILQVFEPDMDTMRHMEHFYRTRNLEHDLIPLRNALAQQTETAAQQAPAPESGQLWIQAHCLYDQLGYVDEAIRCGRLAVQADQYNLFARRTFGRYLLKNQHYSEAEAHLRWCAQRNPRDTSLSRDLNRAMRGRLRMARETRALHSRRIENHH